MENNLEIAIAMMNARLNAIEDVLGQLSPQAYATFQQKMSENVTTLMEKFPQLLELEKELVKKAGEQE